MAKLGLESPTNIDIVFMFPYIVLFGTLGLLCLHYLRNVFRSGLRSIPGPLLAHATSLYRIKLVWKGGAPANYIALHQKYGSIVRTGSNHVSVADPAAMPIIYGISSKFKKSLFYRLSRPYYEGEPLDSMFTVLDPAGHRDLRAPTAQVYSMTNLRNYEQHIDECTDIFFGLLEDVNGLDDIDFTKFFNWYTFDAITAITYQSRFGFLEARSDINNMMAGIDVQAIYFAYVGQFPHLHRFLYDNRLFVKAVKWLAPDFPDPLADIHSRVAFEIDRYNSSQDQKHVRKDFLAQLTAKDDPNRTHYRRDMTNHLSNNILAGSDTTSIALRSIFYFLCKNQKVYAKVQDEIDRMHDEGQFSKFVTYDESQKLSYLQATIREAMRLHPSNCYPLERVAPPGGAQICGHYIPAGTVVSIMAPVINRARNIYGEDADEFRPERWLEANPEELKAMDRTFFTFGHGSRACIGRNIAMMEISKFVPQVLRYWKVEWTRGAQPWKTHSLWFYQQQVYFKFSSRSKKD